MRIVCDNCGAKYQISDDKVRNKVFKIRCKKCSHTIVVRSKGDGPSASGESNEDATRVAPAPTDAGGSVEAAPDAIWYVVVNREQVGPMTPAEVERRYKAGEIDADAFTWAEGMTDWIRLAAVTEFAHMFPEKAPARAPAPVRAAAPAPVAVAAAPAAKGGGLFPRDEGDDDVMVSGNDSQTSSGGADRLFGGVDDDEPAAASPRVEDGPRLRSQRNENSVLFSLDSLSSAAESPRVSNTGGTEGSGLIDISAMLGGGSSSSSSSGNDSFGGPIGLAPSAPAPMAGAPLPSLVNRKKSNTGLIVGIVAGAVIIAGGIVAAVVLKGGDKPAEPVANNAPAVVSVGGDAPKSATPATQPPSAAAVASAAVSEPPSAAAPVSVAANDAAGKPAAGGGARPAGGGGGPRVAAAGGRPGGGDEDTPSVAAPRPASPSPAPATDAPKPQKKSGGDGFDDIMDSLDGKGGSKPAGGGKPAAAAAPADDPLLPEQLTKPQILGVVKKAASQISSCKDRDPNASGTVMVSIQIEKSGRVGKATAKSPFAGTPVGNCVESTVRTFQFPQFSGDQMTINMPFAL
jgi:predicted Zn finger-like uncharacterized protein